MVRVRVSGGDQADVEVELGEVEVRAPRVRLLLEHLRVAVHRLHELVALLVSQALQEEHAWVRGLARQHGARLRLRAGHIALSCQRDREEAAGW